MKNSRRHIIPLSLAAFAAVLAARHTAAQTPTATVKVAPKPVAPKLPVAPAPTPTPSMTAIPITPIVPLRIGLRGWVDLHAHPMVHLGFGGKLVHGAPDVGTRIPADDRCQKNVSARDMAHALGSDNSTHGGWGAFDNTCGDDIRKAVIDNLQSEKGIVTPDKARGFPDYTHWPKWNDITHQKMWWSWIKRARDGGQRVMVALATHNQTLAAATSGPGDGPTDDKGSADVQIDETIRMVDRHKDFMEIARSPADLRRIVGAGKLAVVLGVELDAIGNFHKIKPTQAQIAAELDRLRTKGVRYIFPVHLIDNPFGGTAIYENLFNTSNYREFGSFWSVRCHSNGPYPSSVPLENRIQHKVVHQGYDAAIHFVKTVKLGIDANRYPSPPPTCSPGVGHANARGLTPEGEIAIREMMKRGMLIDVDHMSELTMDRAIAIAESIPGGGYPVVAGHTNIRNGGAKSSERDITPTQAQRIGRLGGMVGLGGEGLNALEYAPRFKRVADLTGNRAGFGTDLNGLVKGNPPRAAAASIYGASFQPHTDPGSPKQWRLNVDGVAHYGMLADFVKDMRNAPNGAAIVDGPLMSGAEAFASMWEKAEKQRTSVR